MTTARTRTRWALGTILVLASTASLVSGCADLIGGIGTPPVDADAGGDGPDDGLIEDKETGIRTTPECVDYCDDMGKNCGQGSGFQQYTDRSWCVSVCNTYEPGDGEPVGNTLACRAARAQSAATAPSEDCADAGPASSTCGSKCESWCSLMEACPNTRIAGDGCLDACNALPTSAGFNVVDMAEGNSLECRIYHATAAITIPTASHCLHAQYWSNDFCIESETDEINCPVYCQNVKGACRDEKKLYDTDEECLAACAAFPLGEARKPDGLPNDIDQNTIACRSYHANSALNSPEPHCAHAGPTGGGHCGTEDKEAGTTGNCDSYCLLYQTACGDDFGIEFADGIDSCRAKCAETFAETGSISDDPHADMQYFAATATDADTLQCRVFYAVQALTLAAGTEVDPVAVQLACSHAHADQEATGGCPQRPAE